MRERNVQMVLTFRITYIFITKKTVKLSYHENYAKVVNSMAQWLFTLAKQPLASIG